MMDRTFFRKVVNECLVVKGFKKKRSRYFKESEEILMLVTVQKSSFSDTYYFNFGFAIKELLDDPSEVVNEAYCHVRSRFFFIHADGDPAPWFDLDDNNEENLRNGINQEMNKYLTNVQTVDDLLDLVKKYPELLVSTNNIVRKFLGITEMM